ncbi:MAG: surface lipoprotein assembly modifier, partial [Rhizomicrobium sp.]
NNVFARSAAVLAAIILTMPVHARAQEARQSVAISVTQAAQLLMENGRYDEARTLLDRELQAKPDDSETLFLLANLDVAQKDYAGAIARFRRILAREPDAERVRLELARAFFLDGDYDNADRQFRFARAGDIPDTVKDNIDKFLSAITRLRQWQGDVSLALAPDTNQNTGTAASQVIVFGLPFVLDPNARRQSGVGIAGGINGEWSPLLWDNVKLRMGGDLSRLDYSGGHFDDMTASAYAGPQFLYSNWDFSILATGFDRWYGNRPYLAGAGGKIAAEVGILSDLLVGGSVGAQDVRDHLIPQQNGPLYSAQAQAIYVLSPSRLIQLQGGFNRQEAQIAPYSYSGIWFGAGYQQDLSLGFSAGFQPSYYITHYDAALAAFGVTRNDNAVMLSFSLLNRRLDYHGFTPRLSYVFTDQHSNIPLYSYTRSQIQLGLTSLF